MKIINHNLMKKVISGKHFNIVKIYYLIELSAFFMNSQG